MLSFFFMMIFSGMTWLVIGFFLMSKGLGYLVMSAQIPVSNVFSLVTGLTPVFGSRDMAAISLIVISMMIGWIKGRVVLAKTARKVMARVRLLKEPIKLTEVYNLRYLILIGSMIALGISLKLLHVPTDVLGCVDVAVGTALVQGSVVYFRGAAERKRA